MSVRHVTAHVVDCDGCRLTGDLNYDEVDAREQSVNDDWRTDGEHDWCPDCQKVDHECAPDPQDRYTCARCSAPLGFEDEKTP